ncbi:hypothetical protein KB976_000358 [Vibrio parahaemolyticus]|nr:hypothetical protein [Vibrio parahaemolyticus]
MISLFFKVLSICGIASAFGITLVDIVMTFTNVSINLEDLFVLYAASFLFGLIGVIGGDL